MFHRYRVEDDKPLVEEDLKAKLQSHVSFTRRLVLARADEIIDLLRRGSEQSRNTDNIHDNGSNSKNNHNNDNDNNSNNTNVIWEYIGEHFDDLNLRSDNGIRTLDNPDGLHNYEDNNIYNNDNRSNDSNIITIPFDESAWNKLVQFFKANEQLLSYNDPELLAKFATGVVSPRLRRMRLGKHSLFGSASCCQWSEVLSRCQLLCSLRRGCNRELI